MVDEPGKGPPDVVLELDHILDDCVHFLSVSEAVVIHQLFVFIQEIFDVLVDFAREVWCIFGSCGWHARDALSGCRCHC